MHAQLLPEVVVAPDSRLQPDLPLACEGVQRYVWQSQFGAMLIEVKDELVFVNGKRIEPHVSTGRTKG